VEALSWFLPIFKKRLTMGAAEWFFHWNEATGHTTAVARE
jgi:hypothetical protein